MNDSKTAQLAVRGITKTYGSLHANDDVSLTIMPGSIHALLGENGAGKSTLVKTIYGLVKPDAGEILWRGEVVTIANPKAAMSLGIGMVFQHFSLFESMTVLENIMLGVQPSLLKGDFAERIVAVSEQYGLPLDPRSRVYDLSVGERQRIEIVRCLLQSPQLLIMDEPTSVLTPQEVDLLFVTLRQLAAEGVSILYISHKLEEIRALCDTATIMRAGKVVTSCTPKDKTAKALAELMIGSLLKPPQRTELGSNGEERLRVTNLSRPSLLPHGVSLHDINLSIRAGQVLGIAGVAGNGQIELMRLLIGEYCCLDNDTLMIDGVAAGKSGPAERRLLGAAFVPEERLGHGAVPTMSLWENALLSAAYPLRLLNHGFIRIGQTQAFTQRVIKQFSVKTQHLSQQAGSLSGGNLQKFIFGREILQQPRVFIVLQPTWGVDAGAAAVIRQALIDLASKEQAAVLVISQDLDELFEVSTDIAVMDGGRLSKPCPVETMTPEKIGLLMGGGSACGDNSQQEATNATA